MFRGRRASPQHFSALASTMAPEPQDVFGADTGCPYLDRETKSEHVARDRRRQDQHCGKNTKSALKGSLSLDNRGPHKCSAGYDVVLGACL
jgi:hypothetical protein